MAISAREELRHVADTATAEECEVYLAGPMLLAACETILPLLTDAPTAELLRRTIAEARGRTENAAP